MKYCAQILEVSDIKTNTQSMTQSSKRNQFKSGYKVISMVQPFFYNFYNQIILNPVFTVLTLTELNI